jgi:hypothetical protein
MSDRPQSTAPPLDPLAHPLREAFAFIFRAEDAVALAGGVALAGSLLTEGGEALAGFFPGRRMPATLNFRHRLHHFRHRLAAGRGRFGA